MNEDQTLYISFFITESAPSYSVLKPCQCLGQQQLTLCIKTSSAVDASCICLLMYFRVKIIFFYFGFLHLALYSIESTSCIYIFMPCISPYSLLYTVTLYSTKKATLYPSLSKPYETLKHHLEGLFITWMNFPLIVSFNSKRGLGTYFV